jgi:RHS repeat-associated protein
LSGTPTFSYSYDSKGNIATYTAPGKSQITYTYDANNQLTKAQGAKTYTYTYDNAGNITKAVKDGVTYNYTYGDSTWKDLLTAYNGSSITYDTIGNPTKYYNGWNFTWEHGREMATATNGTTSLSFKYDANGLRTSKTVNGVEHTYYYYGGKLLRETYGSNILDFYYDASGVPYMLEYNGTVYYYVTNAQGDVIRIVNSGGTSVADYEYDPYGASVTAEGTLATINPLRYRSYYFDTESGLYYLQSRYYDPNTGRFINADALISTGQGVFGNNMFAYCLNNPVLYVDYGGSKASLPPMVENGLNLPASGGIPIEINGTTYYYAIDVQNGQLYEYWFDVDGNLVHGRHHSDHNKPWKHEDPHDHKGGKDKNGNNTLVGGPQPVDEKFHGPDKSVYEPYNKQTAEYVVTGVALGYAVYQVAKWAIATFLAPTTGGGSYAFAALMP